MAYLTTLKDKKVGVLGLGVSGLSAVSFLLANGIKPFVMDSNLKSKGVEHVATHWPEVSVLLLADDIRQCPSLLDVDLLIVSPGIALSTPILMAAADQGAEIIGDVELFARVNRQPVIAVSGSNGKSTVTKLVAALLCNGDYHAVYGGNIGIPVLDLLAKPFDIAVLELSSFQLETTSSLHVQTASVLNVSEDHMDRYDSFDAYVAAKRRIYTHSDLAVYNDRELLAAPQQSHPAQVVFSLDAPKLAPIDSLQHINVGIHDGCFAVLDNGEARKICPLDALSIVGQHNVLNALAAIALVLPFRLDNDVIEKTLREFVGLPHRCERIEGTGDVLWINDSKATNVGATVAALNGIKPQCQGKLILLAGGVGKAADFSPLKAALENHVDHLITFGCDGEQIAALAQSSTAIRVNSMEEAVDKAFALANSGDCVLLSPACASFDMYTNFEARGVHFMALARELHHVD
ncbi:MAG: UDP-N-acetylmuramoylalanine--D-glutamate ligase [Phenylobacterium sp.]|jgi:UDP-N-acetylmuramoylalanine--D-glutamate ligase